jgi:deoxyribodipyrimidine photo-lyase
MFAAFVPRERIRSINAAPINPEGDYVLYWMIATRRVAWSFALDHAVDLARELGRPLVIFEALRCGYRWASDRLHRFVIEGMRDNQRGSSALALPTTRTSSPGRGWARGCWRRSRGGPLRW